MGICQEHGRYGPSEDPKFADVKVGPRPPLPPPLLPAASPPLSAAPRAPPHPLSPLSDHDPLLTSPCSRQADLALLKQGATAILQRALSWPEAKPAKSHGAGAGAATGPLPVTPQAKAVAVGEAGTAKMAGAIGSRITIDEPPQPQAQAQTRLASRPPSKRSKGPKLTSSMPPDQHH